MQFRRTKILKTERIRKFLREDKSGGIVLIAVTLLSLMITNSNLQKTYLDLWHYEIVRNFSFENFINDGLMSVFFLFAGLELVIEAKEGELSDWKKAILPVGAAIGGMIVPILFYTLWNAGTDTWHGFGIPMATDIAFSLGILSLLGKRIPESLKIFLMALAVVDDMGAIVVIALFYASSIDWFYLALSLSVFALLFLLNKGLKIKALFVYIAGGVLMWFFMWHSGIHATVAGILLAIVIPYHKGGESSPAHIVRFKIHEIVNFIIIPLFALCNTAIPIRTDFIYALTDPYSLGIFIGLVFGKPLGVFSACYLLVKLKICRLSAGIKWKDIMGTGFLCGIGFTMSIFVATLAFKDQTLVDNAKLMILLSSFIAGIVGFLWLKRDFKPSSDE